MIVGRWSFQYCLLVWFISSLSPTDILIVWKWRRCSFYWFFEVSQEVSLLYCLETWQLYLKIGNDNPSCVVSGIVLCFFNLLLFCIVVLYYEQIKKKQEDRIHLTCHLYAAATDASKRFILKHAHRSYPRMSISPDLCVGCMYPYLMRKVTHLLIYHLLIGYKCIN